MSNNGNNYFETVNRIEGEFTEDVLIQRINQCTMVISEISNNGAWKVLLEDVKGLMEVLDNSWQSILPNSDKFQEARLMKMVCKHIFDFPDKYHKEMEDLEEKLLEMRNPGKIIGKDNDNE